MPIVIRCPSCQKQVRVPDNLLGKTVRCPGCKETFTAAADEGETPAAPRPREEEAPRPVKRKPAPPPEEDKDQDDGAGYQFQKEAPPPRRPARRDEDEEDEEEDEDYEEEPRPRRRRRRVRNTGALDALKAPAIIMMVLAGIGALLCIWGAIQAATAQPQREVQVDPNMNAQQKQFVEDFKKWAQVGGTIGIISNGLFLLLNGAIVLGSVRMLQGKMRWLGITASVLSMINLGCCCVTLPFGIWALVVLLRPEVAEAFG